MLHVAMLSKWHVHAGGYAKTVLRHENCTISAVWDEDPERGSAWAEELGCPFVADLDTLLADPGVDAVVVNAPTDQHGTVLRKAAEAGKHIFTEKVLTLCTEDALAVAKAVRENGVRFTISFPHKTANRLQFVKRLCDNGELGTLTYARVRNCHSGSINDWLPPHFYDRKQCGGGAMIDLGAHPMYLLLWLLGKPVSVQSAFTNVTDRPVEDNAVSILTFESGAIGVSETGFVSRCDPYIVEVSGTNGFVRVSDNTVTYRTVNTPDGAWIVKERPGEAMPNPLDTFLDGCLHGTPEEPMFSIEDAVELTRLMEAAYRPDAVNGAAL